MTPKRKSGFLKRKINEHRAAAIKSGESAERAGGYKDMFVGDDRVIQRGSSSRKRLDYWGEVADVERSSKKWHLKRMKRLQALRRLVTKNPRKARAKRIAKEVGNAKKK